MYLTIQNAEQYVGKTITAKRGGLFHHYPLKVFKYPDGTYGYSDRAGVGMLVPDEKETFNTVWFDTVLESEE